MAETTDSPTNYYISTGSSRRSTLDEINVQNSVDFLLLQSYRLLVYIRVDWYESLIITINNSVL